MWLKTAGTTGAQIEMGRHIDRESLVLKHPRLEFIQALRGLAALLVVAFHIGSRSKELLGITFVGDIFSMGGSGVDFFFILSGFIILFIHEVDWGESSAFTTFAWKRWIRIYPFYLLVCGALLPIYLSGYGNGTKRNMDVIARSLFLFPQSNGIHPIVNVAWTLSHEVFFYLMFSVGILLPRSVSSFVLGALLSVSTLLFGIGLENPAFLNHSMTLDFVFSRYNLEFAAGCLCAWVLRRKQIKNPWVIVIVGFVMLAIAWWSFCSRTLHLNSVVLFGVPYSFIVLGASQIDVYRPSGIPHWMSKIGDATYSIYLTHFCVLTVIFTIVKRMQLIGIMNDQWLLTISFLVAVSIGCVIHEAVERPMLDAFRRCRVRESRELLSDVKSLA
jgi:exopolysaccharide production protein ExoZ